MEKFRDLLESTKPKNFFIHRPRPNSKKWEVTSKKDDSEVIEVSLDEENFSINFDGVPTIYYGGTYGVDWNGDWDWSQFGSKAGSKIESMIKYLKEI